MRLGGPIFEKIETPDDWVQAHHRLGYSAIAYPPFGSDNPRLKDFVSAAQKADLPIAEVGAWSNPISKDPAERKTAFEKCCAGLALAEEIGARCCVNIAGSRGKVWDGPDPENLTDETFDLIVQSVRAIIDAVKPTRTFYSLETMPWIFPDSPDSYLALVKAIDRKHFAVHLDPVNMINCPRRAFQTADFLRECFAKLGPYIKSAHAKDIRISDKLTLHLDECRPGTGLLDYATFLREMSRLQGDVPLIFEHLSTAEEYAAAAAHVRNIALSEGVDIK
jgi:sugar phosphate isomerase/epimerase